MTNWPLKGDAEPHQADCHQGHTIAGAIVGQLSQEPGGGGLDDATGPVFSAVLSNELTLHFSPHGL